MAPVSTVFSLVSTCFFGKSCTETDTGTSFCASWASSTMVSSLSSLRTLGVMMEYLREEYRRGCHLKTADSRPHPSVPGWPCRCFWRALSAGCLSRCLDPCSSPGTPPPSSPSPSVTGSWLSLVLALGSQEQVLYHRATLTSSHSSIWRQHLAKLPKLALNSLCSPGLPRMCVPPASVSREAGITGQSHQALSELGF